jgi:hypothetical protein
MQESEFTGSGNKVQGRGGKGRERITRNLATHKMTKLLMLQRQSLKNRACRMR